MRLERYDASTIMMNLDNAPLTPSDTGRFVLFSDVKLLIDSLCTMIEAHDGNSNNPRNEVFMQYPTRVWNAVVDRDFDISAAVYAAFAEDNNL